MKRRYWPPSQPRLSPGMRMQPLRAGQYAGPCGAGPRAAACRLFPMHGAGAAAVAAKLAMSAAAAVIIRLKGSSQVVPVFEQPSERV